MKKIIAAVLAASLVMGVLTACADENSSSKTETGDTASRAAQPAAKQGAKDADFFEFYYTGGAEDFLGKTIDEINSATGDKFTEANASEYDLEYGSAEIEMHTDSIKAGDRVVIVDDLIATGGTVKACCELVEKLGGTVERILFLLELKGLNGREALKGYDVRTVVQYEGK